MVSCCGCCGDSSTAFAMGSADNDTTGYSESSGNLRIKYSWDANESKTNRPVIDTNQTVEFTSKRKNRISPIGTSLNSNLPDADLIRHETTTSGPYLISRKKKCFYNVSFPSRPLYLKLTSSSRSSKDGYIIEVDNKCPVSDAQEAITIESKVIYINGKLVEGCTLREISRCVRSATLPIRLTLVGPEHLSYDETPDHMPEIIEIL